MVKVLVDGKEYEGREFWHETEYFGKSLHIHEMKEIKKEEPKEFVSVPKEIKFVLQDVDAGNMGLMFAEHLFFYSTGNWHLIGFTSLDKKEEYVKLDCVLVPCERKDLKAGDWAFWEALDVIEYTNIRQYVLALNPSMGDFVSANSFPVGINVGECKVGEAATWFRVVPKERGELSGKI